jgi:hypothetical protein
VRDAAGDEGARARAARDLGQAVAAAVAEVRQLALQRPEELGRGMGVERRRAAAGSDLDLHREEAGIGLLVAHVERHEILHDVEGLGER